MQQRVLLSLTSWCEDILLDKPDIFIGRFDTSDVVINLPHISARHCRIILAAPSASGKTMVQDLSSNGTFVEGARLVQGRFHEIKNGDTIMLTPPNKRDVEAVGFVFRDGTCHQQQQTVGSPHTMRSASFISPSLLNFDLQVIKPLGRGSFGEVHLCVKDHTKYAVKVVRKRGSNDSKLFDEVRVMERLKFPHIVGIHKVWDLPDSIIMSLDFAGGGDLESLLRVHAKFGECDAKSTIVQILNALQYLHDNRVIHRDLKPENVLLKYPVSDHTKIPHLLLTDFGMSRMFDTSPQGMLRAQTICGTPNYVACEIVYNSRNKNGTGYTELVDLWSAGVLLYRLVNGCLPWQKTAQSSSLTDQILHAGNPKTPVEMVDNGLSKSCVKFIRALVVAPEHRMSATKAIKHEWIAGGRRHLAVPPSMDEATQDLHNEEDDEGDDSSEEDEEQERSARGSDASNKRMRSSLH